MRKIRKPGNQKIIFKPRKQEVLERTFSTREERPTSGGRGIFKDDALPEFIPARSDDGTHNEIFIGPIDFEGAEGYHVNVAVHYQVGLAGDMYICPMVYHKGLRCPICEEQQKLFAARRQRGETGVLSDEIKNLYPKPAVVYICLDMNKMEEGWKLWRAGKTVHVEVAARTHNKKTQEYIDLCDMEKGKIVSFTCTQKRGEFPKYINFNLDPLEEPIPYDLQEKLADIIEKGMEVVNGSGAAIKQYLHIPSYKEINEAYLSSVDSKESVSYRDTVIKDEDPSDENWDEDSIIEELEGKSRLQIKRWAREREIDIQMMDREEMISSLVEALAGEPKNTEKEKPECFGEAEDYQECVECEWLELGCAEETEARRS